MVLSQIRMLQPNLRSKVVVAADEISDKAAAVIVLVEDQAVAEIVTETRKVILKTDKNLITNPARKEGNKI